MLTHILNWRPTTQTPGNPPERLENVLKHCSILERQERKSSSSINHQHNCTSDTFSSFQMHLGNNDWLSGGCRGLPARHALNGQECTCVSVRSNCLYCSYGGFSKLSPYFFDQTNSTHIECAASLNLLYTKHSCFTSFLKDL